MLTDEIVDERSGRNSPSSSSEIHRAVSQKAQQCRQKLLAIPRGMKPKQHRRLRWGLARLVVKTSRLVPR